ncbi:Zinc finger, CCHC-type superfamily [Sesbania bispinosa]|nr:Zinc finger, CCHC-type superfamily [Sesbania bispinosa]
MSAAAAVSNDAAVSFTNVPLISCDKLVDEHAKQRGKIFMVLALAGHPHDLDSVRNQILSSPTIPSYDTVCEQLLRLSVPQSFAPSASASFPVSDDSIALVSNSYHRGGRGGRGGYRTHPRCNYCKRFGHVEEQCRTKANQQQPKILNVAQFTASGTSDQVSLSTDEYDEYTRLKAAMQPTTPVASVAHTEGIKRGVISNHPKANLKESLRSNRNKANPK